QEASARTLLQQVRAAEKAYAAENANAGPKDLALLSPKYLPALPPLTLGADHAATAAVTVYGPEACSGSKEEGQQIQGAALKDTGGWGYVAAPGAACDGAVF